MARSDTQPRAADWVAATPWTWIGVLGLILLVGINVRTPLLSVPPVLAVIHDNLGLDYGKTGLLTALPSLMMGLGAWPAGRLAGRVGGRVSVALGLTLVLAGTVARSVWPATFTLYFFTAALAAGIALAQTSVPLLVRQWFPTRIGLASAIFTDGLTLGETFAAAATVPLMRAWFGANAWPAALLIWAVPMTVGLLLWLWLAPPAPPLRFPQPAPSAATTSAGSTAEPAIHAAPHVSPWMLGAIMGGGSVIYFGMNGWIANYNQALHASGMTSIALSALNAAQLPICFGLTVVAQRVAGKRWPFIVAGIIALVAIIGWLVTPPTLEPLWGSLLGACSAGVFTLSLALPAIFGHGAYVARLAGGSLAVSYTATFIGPYLGGVLWDTFHMPWLAFLPVIVAALWLLVASSLLPTPPDETHAA